MQFSTLIQFFIAILGLTVSFNSIGSASTDERDKVLIEKLNSLDQALTNYKSRLMKILHTITSESNLILNNVSTIDSISSVQKGHCHEFNLNMTEEKSFAIKELQNLISEAESVKAGVENVENEVKVAILRGAEISGQSSRSDRKEPLEETLGQLVCMLNYHGDVPNTSSHVNNRRVRHADNKKEKDPKHRCPDGEEIPKRWLCDGSPDCRDGSDEKKCHNSCDSEFEWQCDNSKCVWRFRVCDGKDDCGDRSDEEDCDKVATNNASVKTAHKDKSMNDANHKEVENRNNSIPCEPTTSTRSVHALIDQTRSSSNNLFAKFQSVKSRSLITLYKIKDLPNCA